MQHSELNPIGYSVETRTLKKIVSLPSNIPVVSVSLTFKSHTAIKPSSSQTYSEFHHKKPTKLQTQASEASPYEPLDSFAKSIFQKIQKLNQKEVEKNYVDQIVEIITNKRFCIPGEGRVLKQKGFGSLMMLEVKMPNGVHQVVRIDDTNIEQQETEWIKPNFVNYPILGG